MAEPGAAHSKTPWEDQAYISEKADIYLNTETHVASRPNRGGRGKIGLLMTCVASVPTSVRSAKFEIVGLYYERI
jgi:hypothetical protein